MNDLSDAEYQALADFRYQIRSFLRFSEDKARANGLEPQQHQLLLAIRGLPAGSSPTIGEIAQRLQLKHHSVVELLDRMEKHGHVSREPNPEDRREVIVRLTRAGKTVLRRLSLSHHEELETAGPALSRALSELMNRKVPA